MKTKKFKRGAGILLAVSSLPSPYGIGTFGKDAYEFVDTLAKLKQRYWQVLPLGPTSIGDSPYQSFSAFAGSPYYIDLDILIEEHLLEPGEVRDIHWGDNSSEVDYGALYEHRFTVLRKAFDRFDREDVAFQTFCEEKQNWLEDYALYMALKGYFGGREWGAWDADIRDRQPKAIQHYQAMLIEDIGFWKFCQYKFFEQWHKLHTYAREKKIEIIGDIPLYLALDSADVWAKKELFLLGKDGTPTEVAGCPPDAFSDEGQKWGNPLYNWKAMEKTEFSWWKDRIRANAQMYDIIRIDHFIGVVQYYSIPAQEHNGKNGKWNKGPGKKLTDAITSALGESKIIAEDLGVEVPGVKKLIQKTGWLGMKILLFAFDGNTAHEYLPHNYKDSRMVVYGGTHDNETLAGYFGDKKEEELKFLYEYLGIRTKAEIPNAIIRLGYASIADVVIFQMQDILGLGNETRMNFPATIGKNWKWRYHPAMLSKDQKRRLKKWAVLYRRRKTKKEKKA